MVFVIHLMIEEKVALGSLKRNIAPSIEDQQEALHVLASMVCTNKQFEREGHARWVVFRGLK